MYLKEDKINKYFIAQVDRIGAQWEALERALAKTPRKVDRKNDKGDTVPVEYSKWKYLDLRKKWFAYMDEVYERANKKGQKFMKVNIDRLKEEYTDAKKIDQKDVDKEKDKKKQEDKAAWKALRDDMPAYITKLEAAWKKADTWNKPKWNAKMT
jgi:hypothetical protein